VTDCGNQEENVPYSADIDSGASESSSVPKIKRTRLAKISGTKEEDPPKEKSENAKKEEKISTNRCKKTNGRRYTFRSPDLRHFHLAPDRR
jgi:hypothetical protein